jgi:hypothetical protein
MSQAEPADGMIFVSEPIVPEAGTFAPEMMARGLASLPGAFTWRGRRYRILECLEHVKQSSPEATGEVYLRRQEFLVRLDSGQLARVYVQRQAPAGASRAAAKQRWFLYTIQAPGGQA